MKMGEQYLNMKWRNMLIFESIAGYNVILTANTNLISMKQ